MPSSRWTLEVSPPFDYRAAAYSHGWVVLAPTSVTEEDRRIERTERLASGEVVHLTLRGAGSDRQPAIEIDIHHRGRLGEGGRQEIERSVSRMFRLDEDFSEFYAICIQKGPPWSRLANGSGRLFRSPSLFEDVVKTICTTNIQWSGTKSMVRNLVEALGDPFPLDPEKKAFPTPRAIAGAPPEQLAEARLGYRGPYILKLAQDVASGDQDLGSFEDPAIPTPDLRKMLLGIKGVGGYAAATLLMLLGRYEFLGFDTEMRDFVARQYNQGVTPTEEEAFAIYEAWGKWKYLAYWFDNYPDE